MIRAASSFAILFLLACSSLVGAQENNDRFARWDRNGDGVLTQDELPEQLQSQLDSMDENNDGQLTRDELRSLGNRRQQARLSQLRESVNLIADLPYAGTENPRQTLDLLLPKNAPADNPLPVVVFIHGGAWQGGDKRAGWDTLAPLVTSGRFAGISVGYRLSGEATWPAQIHDCKAAIRWIRAHAAEHRIDPERIAVIGPSAGGHLAAMLGTSGGVATLEGELGKHTDQSSQVRCVVDLFGPADLLAITDAPSQLDHAAPDSPESRLLGGPLRERAELAREASPITYIDADDPPVLILHGDEDPIVPYDQSERLHRAYKQAGATSYFIRIEGGGHGGFRNPEIDRRIALFLDKYLHGIEPILPETPIPAVAARER